MQHEHLISSSCETIQTAEFSAELLAYYAPCKTQTITAVKGYANCDLEFPNTHTKKTRNKYGVLYSRQSHVRRL